MEGFIAPKLLNRFFEPLVLLHTFGEIRGEHTRKLEAHNDEDLATSSARFSHRSFLNDLAYVCNYDKGGDTVTAIGVECSRERYTFWVAANEDSSGKILPFLQGLLRSLKQISDIPDDYHSDRRLQAFQSTFEQKCAIHASLKLAKYKDFLLRALERCLEHSIKDGLEFVKEITEWTTRLETIGDSLLELCMTCYKHRKSPFVKAMREIGQETSYGSPRMGYETVCGEIGHYIGRLAHQVRASRGLVAAAATSATTKRILEYYDARSVPFVANIRYRAPPVRQRTTLEAMIGRVFKSGDTELKQYSEALAEMDRKFGLNERFVQAFEQASKRPRIHAELQVLEHFHLNRLKFLENDRYIACSKAACFCCLLYIRHHPGNFVQPESHQKVYINWAPPEVSRKDHSKGILNYMVADVRKQLLDQIREQAPPYRWHPDSLTGITASLEEASLHSFEDPMMSQATGSTASLQDSNNSREHLAGSQSDSPYSDLSGFQSDNFQTTSEEGDGVERIQFEPLPNPQRDVVEREEGANWDNDGHDSDDEQDGGVSLAEYVDHV